MMTTISDFIRNNVGKEFIVNLDPDDVSIAGQKNICKMLSYNKYLSPDYTFDWRVRTSRGTLGKRISSWLYNEHEQRVSPAIVEEINNIADRYRTYMSTFFFKFDDGMFWRFGEFGDDDSCYWGSKSSMRAMLNGSRRVYAIKLYTDESFMIPFGRALLVLNSPNNESLMCINAYPKGFQITNVGRLLVKLGKMNGMKLSTDWKYTIYKHDWKNYIWINGGNGAIVTRSDMINTFENHVDLYDSVKFENCSCCKKSPFIHVVNDHVAVLCENCVKTVFAYCSHCNNLELKKNLKHVDDIGQLCMTCVRRYLRVCSRCGREVIYVNVTSKPIYLDDLGSYLPWQCHLVFFHGIICGSCKMACDISDNIREDVYAVSSTTGAVISINNWGFKEIHKSEARDTLKTLHFIFKKVSHNE